MNKFDEFDKQFNKTSKRIGCAAIVIIAINMIISLSVLGGIGWLVYVILKHFGIVG